MMARTHLATGFTTGAVVTSAAVLVGVPLGLALLAGPVTAYSALLPDLDHRNSTVTYSLGPVTIALSWLLRLFVEHRGATHRPEAVAPAAAIVAAPLVWLPAPLGGWSALLWWAAIAAGWATHLWGDARTLSGIPWNGGRLRIGRTFRTGSAVEDTRFLLVYGPAAGLSWVGVAVLLLWLR